MPLQYKEQEHPLYCFKLVEREDDVYVERYEIPEWIRFRPTPYRDMYYFPAKYLGGNKYGDDFVKANKIDKLSYSKVFTFNDDIAAVRELITKELSKRVMEAEEKLARHQAKLEGWMAQNSEGVLSK